MDGVNQNISPADDVNLATEVEVMTTYVPPTMTHLIQSNNVDWTLTDAQVESVEENTRGQGSTSSWMDQRLGRITASNTHRVLTKVRRLRANRAIGRPIDCLPLIESLCNEPADIDEVEAVKYGRTMEPEARQQYIKCLRNRGHKNVDVQQCGLFVDKENSFIGASPDGLVSCCCGQGLLEIKCPLKSSHVDPNRELPSYIDIKDGKYNLKKNHTQGYYSQVITQMGVTGRKWCDFFVYSRHGTITIRVPFDASHWEHIVDACKTFFFEHMVDYMKTRNVEN